VCVDDSADVGASGHDLGVDRVLIVRRAYANQDRSGGVDQVHPIRRDLLHAPTGHLDPHAGPARVAQGGVPPDEVSLPLGSEDSGGEGHASADVVEHGDLLVR